jgi:hypothetical protein
LWSWWPPHYHRRSEASQGEIADPSTTFFSERCHPSGRGGFRALAPPLRQVIWPEKFKAEHIDKYDGSSNPEVFIQVYHTVIEAAWGDDRVKTNYLPEGSIYT